MTEKIHDALRGRRKTMATVKREDLEAAGAAIGVELALQNIGLRRIDLDWTKFNEERAAAHDKAASAHDDAARLQREDAKTGPSVARRQSTPTGGGEFHTGKEQSAREATDKATAATRAVRQSGEWTDDDAEELQQADRLGRRAFEDANEYFNPKAAARDHEKASAVLRQAAAKLRAAKAKKTPDEFKKRLEKGAVGPKPEKLPKDWGTLPREGPKGRTAKDWGSLPGGGKR